MNPFIDERILIETEGTIFCLEVVEKFLALGCVDRIVIINEEGKIEKTFSKFGNCRIETLLYSKPTSSLISVVKGKLLSIDVDTMSISRNICGDEQCSMDSKQTLSLSLDDKCLFFVGKSRRDFFVFDLSSRDFVRTLKLHFDCHCCFAHSEYIFFGGLGEVRIRNIGFDEPEINDWGEVSLDVVSILRTSGNVTSIFYEDQFLFVGKSDYRVEVFKIVEGMNKIEVDSLRNIPLENSLANQNIRCLLYHENLVISSACLSSKFFDKSEIQVVNVANNRKSVINTSKVGGVHYLLWLDEKKEKFVACTNWGTVEIFRNIVLDTTGETCDTTTPLQPSDFMEYEVDSYAQKESKDLKSHEFLTTLPRPPVSPIGTPPPRRSKKKSLKNMFSIDSLSTIQHGTVRQDFPADEVVVSLRKKSERKKPKKEEENALVINLRNELYRTREELGLQKMIYEKKIQVLEEQLERDRQERESYAREVLEEERRNWLANEKVKLEDLCLAKERENLETIEKVLIEESLKRERIRTRFEQEAKVEEFKAEKRKNEVKVLLKGMKMKRLAIVTHFEKKTDSVRRKFENVKLRYLEEKSKYNKLLQRVTNEQVHFRSLEPDMGQKSSVVKRSRKTGRKKRTKKRSKKIPN